MILSKELFFLIKSGFRINLEVIMAQIELKQNTIPELLNQSYHKYSNLNAISYVGENFLTYKDLKEKVEETAHLLLKNGIIKNDKVAILGENSPNWVISYLAINSIGAVCVPILTGFASSDIHHILRSSEVSAIFISEKYLSKISDSDLPDLFFYVSLKDFNVIHRKEKKTKYYDSLLKKLKKNKSENISDDQILEIADKPAPSDLAAIIYTSGTTGNSKGVMLSHNNIVSDVIYSIELFPIDSNDRFLSILPLAHTFEATGGMLCPLSVGVSIQYLKGLPTPQKLLDAMKIVKPTGVLTVPLVVDKIYRKKILPKVQADSVLKFAYKIPPLRKMIHKKAGKQVIASFGGNLRFFMFGGAALNRDVEIFLRDAEISYSTGYGMTETSPIMTINPFGKVKMGSCGKPISGIEMKIHNPDSKTGVGEIIVRGPITMQGYYKNKKATEEIFLEDGWLRTGDLGYFDSENYMFIKGRSKNVIVGPSGENIYPENIELLLTQNEFIQQAVVYENKESILALVYPDYDAIDKVIKASDETTARKTIDKILEKVRIDVNKQLPSFSKINKIIEHQEAFKLTPTNKVKRYLYIHSSE